MDEFIITPETFLDKSVILFGPSNSGKSTVIIDILYHLKPFVDQAIVFSPMDKQNRTFSSGVMPRPLIHYEVTAEILNDLWERQSEFASLYHQVNRITVLERLFSRIPENAPSILLQRYESNLQKTISAMDPESSAAAAVKKNYEEFRVRFYKKYIAKHARYLSSLALSQSEQVSVKNLDFNPRIVVVFDDCTDILKKMKNTKFVQNAFYQGRWSMMTIIMGLHTDKVLEPEIKKNIFVTMYMKHSTAISCFERGSSGLTREEKNKAIAAANEAITPMIPWQVLVYTNHNAKYWKFKAKIRKNFRFCSDAVWTLCDAIASSAEDGMDFKKSRYIRDIV